MVLKESIITKNGIVALDNNLSFYETSEQLARENNLAIGEEKKKGGKCYCENQITPTDTDASDKIHPSYMNCAGGMSGHVLFGNPTSINYSNTICGIPGTSAVNYLTYHKSWDNENLNSAFNNYEPNYTNSFNENKNNPRSKHVAKYMGIAKLRGEIIGKKTFLEIYFGNNGAESFQLDLSKNYYDDFFSMHSKIDSFSVTRRLHINKFGKIGIGLLNIKSTDNTGFTLP